MIEETVERVLKEDTFLPLCLKGPNQRRRG